MVSVCLRTYLLPLNDSALFTRNLGKDKKKSTSLSHHLQKRCTEKQIKMRYCSTSSLLTDLSKKEESIIFPQGPISTCVAIIQII